MNHEVCIRKEYKGRWEARTPLTPDVVAKLVDTMKIHVERSTTRIFPDEDYEKAGANLVHHSNAPIVLGIKEPPIDIIEPGEIHLCFSHTIKGQPYNMKLLRTFMDRGCTLIDYEPMRDETGKRVIAFGRYAGIAGAVDSFYVAGRKFAEIRGAGALAHVEQTWRYGSIERLKEALGKLSLTGDKPVRIVIVGTGNVGIGAEEVCQWIGFPKVSAQEVLDGPPAGSWYTVLGTPDVVATRDGSPYDKHQYREHGAKLYESTFERYLGKFDILLQTPYWEEKYPYQLPRDLMVRRKDDLPMVIGDISCDINGSLACTVQESTIDEPAYTYLPEKHEILHDITWDGPSVMAIDHLPCELAIDASQHFSRILKDYLPEIVHMDQSKDLENCGMGRLLRDATIVYKGQLTPRYQYLAKVLEQTKN